MSTDKKEQKKIPQKTATKKNCDMNNENHCEDIIKDAVA